MDEPIIFALTPRGGKWNHRYLVPEGDPCSQQWFSGVAEKAFQQPEGSAYVSLAREVTQPTTGRKGPELLVLYDERLSKMDAENKRRLSEMLTSYFQNLETLIQEVDWDREGVTLLVTRPELNDWRKDFDKKIAMLTRAEPVRHSMQKSRTKRKSGWNRVMKWSVASLLLIIVGVLLWASGGIPVLKDLENLIDSGRSEEDHSAEAVEKLAKIVGVSTDGRSREELAGQLADTLQADLFATPDGVSDGAKAAVPEEQPRQRLQKLLQRFFKVVNPNEAPPETLEELVGEQGPKSVCSQLKRLYDEKEEPFDHCGLFEEQHEEITQALRTIKPANFHEIIAELQKLQHEIEQGLDIGNSGKYKKFFEIVDNKYENKFEPAEKTNEKRPLERNFYLPVDEALANELSDLFNEQEFQDLLDADDKPNGLSQQLAEIRKAYYDEDATSLLISREALDSRLKQYERKPREKSVFQQLKAVVKACAELEMDE